MDCSQSIQFRDIIFKMSFIISINEINLNYIKNEYPEL